MHSHLKCRSRSRRALGLGGPNCRPKNPFQVPHSTSLEPVCFGQYFLGGSCHQAGPCLGPWPTDSMGGAEPGCPLTTGLLGVPWCQQPVTPGPQTRGCLKTGSPLPACAGSDTNHIDKGSGGKMTLTAMQAGTRVLVLSHLLPGWAVRCLTPTPATPQRVGMQGLPCGEGLPLPGQLKGPCQLPQNAEDGPKQT